MSLLKRIWRLFSSESGQDTVEYALLSLAVALAAVAVTHSAAANMNRALVKTDRVFTTAIASCLHHPNRP
jgi:Flp pilus assembly pilin Flp